ncbi:pentapeptide repeat-containing protein [Glutamicibacter arilaitensis]|uniref:Pentapeptide repeat-containing protein n=1 Tax=Glutamicibacter arilaitensis TaxID=256701 RepID=A0A2N7S3V9_9MICC|nr:pentapeptide repeat-containing protein [Glutamicibacter arilaitensis]PMQ20803.1 pentapeptide repeat-containing protein [Glutamicibacter arilaitensis]
MKPKIRRFTLSDLATGYPGDFGDDYIELLHFKDFAEPLAADGARLEECRFSSVQIQSLRNARLIQCELEQSGAPALAGAGAFLNDVRVEHSRFGSADFAEAELDGVVFENCKFGWLNLAGAIVRDVVFRNCQFEEIDLGGRIQRVAFEDSRTGLLTCTGAQLREVNVEGLDFAQVQGIEFLRGAQISALQLGVLAEEMAGCLGIKLAN